MPFGAILAALLLLGPVARAVAADGAPLTRLQLELGGGWRRDRVQDRTGPGTIDVPASGAALSSLAVRLAWWRAGARLGVAAQVQGERFALSGEPGVATPDTVKLTGGDAVAALAWRAGADTDNGSGFGFEAQLGYGFHQVPAVVIGAGPAGDRRLVSDGPRGHGPSLALALRRTLGRRVAMELGGQGIPVLLGARYRGERVRPWRVEGRAALTVALAEVGTTRLSASLAYQPSFTSARGDGAELSQRRHQLGVGLGARWGRPPLVVAAPVPATRATTVTAPVAPAPRPSTINGLVRTEDGQPVPARIAIVELGLEVTADARGAFHLEIPAGQYTLQIEADGFQSQTKQLRTGAGEQRIYNVDLQRERP